MSIVGYARASTQDQSLDSQIDALKAAGAEHIYSDTVTGKNAAPGLVECMKFLRRGDTLLVHSADRLGRSMTDVVTTVTELGERGVEFTSLTEPPFDTTTSGGELFFQICSAFARMNSRIISDRTRAALADAKARGRRGGRPTVMTPERINLARSMRAEKATWETIATALQVGVSSVRRALAVDAAKPEPVETPDTTSAETHH